MTHGGAADVVGMHLDEADRRKVVDSVQKDSVAACIAVVVQEEIVAVLADVYIVLMAVVGSVEIVDELDTLVEVQSGEDEVDIPAAAVVHKGKLDSSRV